ncbi:MAG: hypothetical protein Q6373_017425 [Candidatus Sigynarchaeota archaeon]
MKEKDEQVVVVVPPQDKDYNRSHDACECFKPRGKLVAGNNLLR